MAFLDGLKEKVSGAAISMGNMARSGEAGRALEEKREINAEILRLYGEIGRAYYESANDEALHALCEKITTLKERLRALEVQQTRKGERCPSCGALAAVGANYCANCGKPLAQAPIEEAPDLAQLEYCPECGAMYAPTDAFCPICSAEIHRTPRLVMGDKVYLP